MYACTCSDLSGFEDLNRVPCSIALMFSITCHNLSDRCWVPQRRFNGKPYHQYSWYVACRLLYIAANVVIYTTIWTFVGARNLVSPNRHHIETALGEQVLTLGVVGHTSGSLLFRLLQYHLKRPRPLGLFFCSVWTWVASIAMRGWQGPIIAA